MSAANLDAIEEIHIERNAVIVSRIAAVRSASQLGAVGDHVTVVGSPDSLAEVQVHFEA